MGDAVEVARGVADQAPCFGGSAPLRPAEGVECDKGAGGRQLEYVAQILGRSRGSAVWIRHTARLPVQVALGIPDEGGWPTTVPPRAAEIVQVGKVPRRIDPV